MSRDLSIMVGARAADRAISQPDLITENKILVHIDVTRQKSARMLPMIPPRSEM